MRNFSAMAVFLFALACALLLGEPAQGGSASVAFVVSASIGGPGGQCRVRTERAAVECTRGGKGVQGPYLTAGLPTSAGNTFVGSGQQAGPNLVRYGNRLGVGADIIAASTKTRTVNANGWEYEETTVSW
jgi:hypothetical protein